MNLEEVRRLLIDIKSLDPMTFEDAFHRLLPLVNDYKDEILMSMKNESLGKIRARYIELLSYCDDDSLIPIFENELKSNDSDIVSWSLFALENNSSNEGKMIAEKFKIKNPKFSD